MGTVPNADQGSDQSPGTVPDWIVIRGCSVTAKAQHDCEKFISRLRHRYPSSQIVITGCLPGATPLPLPKGSDPSMGMGTVPFYPVSNTTSRAYLKIQDGCSGKCSFCIVPHFRGKPISVPFEEIKCHASAFIQAGFREIVVTGCNLALYRCNDKNLIDVLASLACLPLKGSAPLRYRVRLGSLEPGFVGNEIIDVFERYANICRFIHISLQSGSDKVLSAMNRPYHIADVARFIQNAFQRLGSFITLGADVITGFPGETEDDFEATRSFLDEYRFTNVHVFPYSERPGTPAATMMGTVPIEVRRERAKTITNEAMVRKRRFAEMFVGRDVEVCVERGGDHGWTSEYLPVKLTTQRPRRSLVHVNISRAVEGVLFE